MHIDKLYKDTVSVHGENVFAVHKTWLHNILTFSVKTLQDFWFSIVSVKLTGPGSKMNVLGCV